MADEEQEGHVLLVAFASQGHLNPMLQFAKSLASKGLSVTIATTDFARDKLTSAVTAAAADANVVNHPIHLEFFSDGLPVDFDRGTHMDYFFEQLELHGPPNLSALISSLSQPNWHHHTFSCLIASPFVPWAVDVASLHCIPSALLFIQPCALFSIYYYFYNDLAHIPSSTNPNSLIMIPGLPSLSFNDLPSFILPSNNLKTITPLLNSLFKNMQKFTWVLANSFYELEQNVIDSMNKLQPITTIGPLVPSVLLGHKDHENNLSVDMRKADDGCIEWLDKQAPKSIVYISFGSIVNFSKEEMENIRSGVERSGKEFLWVVKEGELPRTGGKAVRWCPQAEVLKHEAVGCFVTHCGWNSVLESLCTGVPMVAVPKWTDQPTNAKLLTDVFGVGARAASKKDGLVAVEEVERCVKEVMDGPRAAEIKRRLAMWKEKATAAVAEGGSTERNLNGFVDQIVSRTKKCEHGEEMRV